MKKIKINKVLVGVGALLLVGSLSSCLKNGQYYTDFSAVSASVDLPLAAANSNKLVPFAYDATAASPSIPVVVNLASPNPLNSPTTVSLAVDQNYLDSFNTANGTSYVLMPADAYTVSSWDLTIPAGKRIDSMVVKFDFSKLDLTLSYVLPVTITKASQPIEQWNHLLLNIQVKNQFDADYNMTGYVFHPAVPRAVNSSFHVATAGPYTSTFPFGDLGSAGYLFNATINGTSGTVALTNYQPEGAAPPASSGFMTADNPGGTDYSGALPNVAGVAPWVSSTYNNTYNYDTQTFLYHVGYVGGGTSQNQNTYTRQMYIKLVRK